MSLRPAFLKYIAQTSSEPDGLEVSKGEGIYLYDGDGNDYVDCISGISVSSLGHSHPRIISAIKQQLDLHLHTHVYGEHITAPQVNLAQKLAALLPATLSTTFYTNSGAEAVEGALKLARRYTGRSEIIACRNAYHGSTAGAESLRSDEAYTIHARPLIPGIKHINFNSFDDLNFINQSTAAVITEPIQAEAGIVLPEQGYLSALKQKCESEGALLILDEIQTGMGRTGSFFAFEHENIIPDILLLAKAFGGGLPLGAFISGNEIMRTFQNPPLGHLTTFGGSNLSCAAGLEAINIILENNLAAKAQIHGSSIKNSIRSHPLVKEVRGRGLLLAMELNDATNLLPVIKALRNHGILADWFLFNNKSIRIAPPLTITDAEIEIVCNRIKKALDSLV